MQSNNTIKVLENSLINKIAAGEVIERPASIVKELVENSIDAGADSVSIEIKEGGVTSIKITDNGCGIPRDQIKLAFLRHATSKLERIDDLENILTLGFRGEALSSIASVSQVEVITKTEDEKIGTRLLISGGEIVKEEEVACLKGTTFSIRNVFFNTPARKKFLKKSSVESSYISEVVNKLALGNPKVGFKYINNESLILQTFGNNSLKDAVFNVYGLEVSKNMIELDISKEGFRIFGLIGLPTLVRGNRNYENFFINGRFIKSKLVSEAVEEGFEGKLMAHKFPVFILNMEVPKNSVDVNVHPTKLEVRFQNEDFIFLFIKNAIKDILKKQILIPDFKEQDLVKKDNLSNILNTKAYTVKSQGELDIPKKEKSDEFNFEDYYLNELNKNSNLSDFKENKPNFPMCLNEDSYDTETVQKDYVKPDYGFKESNFQANILNEDKTEEPIKNKLKEQIHEVEEEIKRDKFFKNYKIIGQLFSTYWIIEQDNEMFMIDQHSAHEKIIYEELYKKIKKEPIHSQSLLEPFVLKVSDLENSIIQENLELIQNFGFGIEVFGRNTYAIREVPFIFKGPLENSFFMDIIDILQDKSIASLYDAKVEKIISMSCKKAVKANDKLSFTEAKALIEKLLEIENPFNCPHGRPTIIKMTKYEIEKLFKRIQN